MELLIHNVCKSYPQKGMVLKDLNISLSVGVYGLLGPNGAGKTTLMNLLTTNLKTDQGEILLDGKEINAMGRSYRELIGYAPQMQWMYEDFCAAEYLHYFSALKGIPRKDQKPRVEKLLEQVNLLNVKNHKIHTFSGGMKQRLLLAQAMLNNPAILILDEPTAGLDPKERINIRNLVSKCAKNCLVILATHVVQDVECIANRILLMKAGKFIRTDTPEGLIEEIRGKVYTVRTTEQTMSYLQSECMISNIHTSVGGYILRIVGESPVPMNKRKFVMPTLEDVYLYWMGE